MWPGSWPSATCGSRRSRCRSGSGRPAPPTQLPVLVMVTGYSRWLSARLIPSRRAEDLFAGWWQLLAGLGAVPRALVWDGEAAVGQRRRGVRRADRGSPGVPRRAGHQGPDLRSGRPGGQGPGRAGQRLSGDLVPARPHFTSRPTSTPSSPTGWRWPTRGTTGCWAAPRPTGSTPTGPRCCRCRRSRRPPGWRTRCGCRATTTCAWTPTTTRSTRR